MHTKAYTLLPLDSLAAHTIPGDDAAFWEIAHRLSTTIKSITRDVLKADSRLLPHADDIASDALLLRQRILKFKPGKSLLKTYVNAYLGFDLLRHARCTYLEMGSKGQNPPIMLRGLLLPSEETAASTQPIERAELGIYLEQIRPLLTPDEARVLDQIVQHAETVGEINKTALAEELGMHRSTLYAHLAALRKKLEGDFEN